MSYGGDEQSNGYTYCSRSSTEFAKATALGITFFASAGDDGAISDEGDCEEYDGAYSPSFPATSPYVVSVGGTYGGKYTDDVDVNTQEKGWYNSGGGFSVLFDRPSFQDEAVANYFASDIVFPDSSRYNADGRAHPDLSAQSTLYIIGYEGAFYTVSGTSCSSPTVAGMFAVINDVRLQEGKSTLGYVLPALYAFYNDDLQNRYFNDVVRGHNEGCSDDENEAAFYATAGWDPVTGLGTPKLKRLLNYFRDL
jgi:tripeptidyl-peptidase-1